MREAIEALIKEMSEEIRITKTFLRRYGEGPRQIEWDHHIVTVLKRWLEHSNRLRSILDAHKELAGLREAVVTGGLRDELEKLERELSASGFETFSSVGLRLRSILDAHPPDELREAVERLVRIIDDAPQNALRESMGSVAYICLLEAKTDIGKALSSHPQDKLREAWSWLHGAWEWLNKQPGTGSRQYADQIEAYLERCGNPSFLEPKEDPPIVCKNCGASFVTHSFDCPNCHEPYPDDETPSPQQPQTEDLVEKIAGELVRWYYERAYGGNAVELKDLKASGITFVQETRKILALIRGEGK
jgi:hypothetical protein